MPLPTYEKALHFLDRMDFEKYLELEWKIQIFKGQDSEISIANAGEKSTVKITGTIDAARDFLKMVQPCTGLISPLHVPLEKFMRDESTGFNVKVNLVTLPDSNHRH